MTLLERPLSGRQRRTLSRVLEHPNRADVTWREVEGLLEALGAVVTVGSGSRIRVAFRDRRAVFHRPHPRKDLSKASLKALRRFLGDAEVE